MSAGVDCFSGHEAMGQAGLGWAGLGWAGLGSAGPGSFQGWAGFFSAPSDGIGGQPLAEVWPGPGVSKASRAWVAQTQTPARRPKPKMHPGADRGKLGQTGRAQCKVF